MEKLSEGREQAMKEALRVMANGWAVWREIELELVRQGVGPGLAKRAIYDLEAAGYVERTTAKLYLNMGLSLVRLTDRGAIEAQWEIEGSFLRVSEWEWVDEHHRGGSLRHTAGLLTLAWQARRRGWVVDLCPGRMTYPLGSVEPDMAVRWKQPVGEKDGMRYVEFEVKPRGKLAKWKRYASLPLLAVTFNAGGSETLALEMQRAKRYCGENWYVMSLQELMQDVDGDRILLGHPA